MYCEKCGYKNNEDAKFCKECGNNIENQHHLSEEIKKSVYNKNKANNKFGIISLCFSVLTTILLIITNFNIFIIILGIIALITGIISYFVESDLVMAKVSLIIILIIGIIRSIFIPAFIKANENQKKDDFLDIAKIYINEVRNSVLSGKMKCGEEDTYNMKDGIYYFIIDSSKYDGISYYNSPWNNAEVKGYVKWVRTIGEQYKTEYSILLVDEEYHGIESVKGTGPNIKYESVSERYLDRNSVKLKTKLNTSSTIEMIPENATLCTLK